MRILAPALEKLEKLTSLDLVSVWRSGREWWCDGGGADML